MVTTAIAGDTSRSGRDRRADARGWLRRAGRRHRPGVRVDVRTRRDGTARTPFRHRLRPSRVVSVTRAREVTPQAAGRMTSVRAQAGRARTAPAIGRGLSPSPVAIHRSRTWAPSGADVREARPMGPWAGSATVAAVLLAVTVAAAPGAAAAHRRAMTLAASVGTRPTTGVGPQASD